MAEQIKTRLSAAEFEALPESDFPTELIEGELVVRGVPTVNHQRVTGALYNRLTAQAPTAKSSSRP
jgi:Uma2 family endonuclease